MQKNQKNRVLKSLVFLFSILVILGAFAGCSTNKGTTVDPTQQPSPKAGKVPKYVFLFIGDGMSLPQITASGYYHATIDNKFEGTTKNPTPDNPPQYKKHSFEKFPVLGLANTHDASKIITDSASASTAFATGQKTLDGHLGVDTKGNPIQNLPELIKKKYDYKIGIVTSVSIDHATPAGFYAHVNSRSSYYEIATQLTETNYEYFGGGGFRYPKDRDKDKKDIVEIAKEKGYNVVNTKDEIEALNADSGKTIAITPDLEPFQKVIHFVSDAKEGQMTLADFVRKGIDVLDNDKGFFMMVESGKVDAAAHANDAYSTIAEIQEMELALAEAIKFAEKHPEDTLIIVTADHETGGMTMGFNGTLYDTHLGILQHQKISFMYYSFENVTKYREEKVPFETAMKEVKDLFGLIMPDDADAKKEENKYRVLTAREVEELKTAYAISMIEPKDRDKNETYLVKYTSSNYEPFTLAVVRTLSNKAGISWTTTAHTAAPVPVYAKGVGQEEFMGVYDNTDIFHKIVKILELDK